MKRLPLLLAVARSIAGGAGGGRPGEDALAACSGGDDVTALRLWRPLADRGNASAQFWVGTRYDPGHGAAADPAIAALWCRKAAEQGHANAQHNLGNLYEGAQGVSYRPAQVNPGAMHYSATACGTTSCRPASGLPRPVGWPIAITSPNAWRSAARRKPKP